MKTFIQLVVACLLSQVISAQIINNNTVPGAPNTWTQKTDFAGGVRKCAIGFSIGDKGYLGTGSAYDQPIYFKDFWEFDPETNVWTQKADFGGTARDRAVGFSIGIKGYIGTGYSPENGYLKDFWEYEPAANKWTRKSDLAGSGRYSAFGFCIGYKGYIGTGDIAPYTHSKDFWEYNQASDTWTRKADFGGAARQYSAGFAINGKGYAGTGYAEVRFNDFWEYNPTNDTWMQKANFPESQRAAVVAFAINNKGYLGTGALYHFYPMNDFWEFDPVTNKWTQKANFSGQARDFAVGFSIGNKGYVGTGRSDDGVGKIIEDKVFWEYTPDAQTTAIPSITTFTPTSGPVGTTVTITGTNFGAGLTDNIVYFGATIATVTAASTTSLTVTVPVGATYEPITVTTGGLMAYSAKPFIVTFKGVGGPFTENSFAPKVDIALGYNPSGFSVGDFDGDRKTDMVSCDYSSGLVSIFRNKSSAGAFLFASKVNFITGGEGTGCTTGDLDGDGKLDIVTANHFANTVSVLRNTSTPGNILFAPKIDFPAEKNPLYQVIGDLDGDGRPEIIIANGQSSTFSVLRNISTTGNISFEAKIEFATPSRLWNCAIGDLNGDNKLDIVVASLELSNTFSVFQNTSSIGNISFAEKIDYTTYTQRKYVAIGDLDGDGKPDLAVANFENPLHSLSIFQNTSNNGTISFARKGDYPSGGSGSDVVSITDLDGDGNPDIILNNYWNSNISLFKNISSNGIISFAKKVDYSTGSGPRYFNACDLDGDGKPDIGLTNLFSETISVLRNTIAPTDVPVISAISDINSSQANVHWYAYENASAYKIRAYPAGTTRYKYYGYETPVKDTFKKITNLLPATNYAVQVMAILNGGSDSTGWSAPYTFTTQGYCNPPNALQVGTVTSTSAKLLWSSPVSAVSHYELRIRRNGAPEWTVRPIQPATESITINGLRPGTQYQWQLRSGCINITDKSNWAKGPLFTTTGTAVTANSSASLTAGNTTATLLVSPNPNKGQFTIQAQLPGKALPTTVTLYNNLGAKVWQYTAGSISGQWYNAVALDNKLPAGMYVLMLQRDDLKLTTKLVVSK